MVGLYASFSIAVLIAFVGGRPGMISSATGAMVLLFATLAKEHGLEYLFAATVFTGIIQFILGLLKVGRFLTFIPVDVMIVGDLDLRGFFCCEGKKKENDGRRSLARLNVKRRIERTLAYRL